METPEHLLLLQIPEMHQAMLGVGIGHRELPRSQVFAVGREGQAAYLAGLVH
jgi:hypothetical protein